VNSDGRAPVTPDSLPENSDLHDMRRLGLLKAAPFLATPALAKGDKPIRFVPQANLSALDPVWTTATVVINHAYLVYDTLHGITRSGEQRPQMCAGHEVLADGLTWTFTLRDGLVFHDNVVHQYDLATR
jgi:peptide/nickel transport system substrate-binding protein